MTRRKEEGEEKEKERVLKYAHNTTLALPCTYTMTKSTTKVYLRKAMAAQASDVLPRKQSYHHVQN